MMRRKKTPAPPAPARSTSPYYTHSDPWALAKAHPDPLAVDLNRR